LNKKNNQKRLLMQNLKKQLIPVLAVLLALLIGMIILLIAKRNPIEAYIALFKGSFGDLSRFGDTLQRSTPIIFTGLAVAFAFRCGLFNIGVEGQLLIGALVSAYVGYYVKGLPMIVHLPLTIISGMIAAGIWAAIPAILKAYRGVHEVITTIMLNYIAISLLAYSIETLRNSPIPKTPDILDSAKLAKLGEFLPFFKDSSVNIGFVLAIVTCFLVYFILWKTVLGYEVRAVGYSPLAAEDGGIKISKNIIYAMIISGMLAGLGGVEGVLGLKHSLVSGLYDGYGFEGIAVALLANNNPIGIIISGILLGSLSSGGLYMDMAANVPQDIIKIIQALIIFFVVANQIVRFIVYGKKKEVLL